MCDPDDPDLTESAARWLWDIGALPRSHDSVWARHPVALAFRVASDLAARLDGTRTAYARARQALGGSGLDLDEVLRALETEAAVLQRQQREVDLVAAALEGRRWRERL